MVIDRLERWRKYAGLHPRLMAALEFLRSVDLHTMAAGRHELDGDNLFALVQDYAPKPAEECVWESHRKYADVQYVVRGVERMGYADVGRMTVKQEYDPVKDVAFYSGNGDFLTVPEGTFVIFFALADVHMPGVKAVIPVDHKRGEVEQVRKVVVKVAGIAG
jgi:YhcH/YjgK/YiaL family protein